MNGNQPEGTGVPSEGGAAPGRPSRTLARLEPIVAVAVAGIAIVCVLLFIMVYQGSAGPKETASLPVVPATTCGERTLAYVNSNLVVRGTAATLASVTETHGVYLVTVDYQGDIFPLYVSRDCTLLFRQSLDITAAEPTPKPTPTPVKSGRPAVELYVMSFCPYGKQAETAMKPVADLLGSRADIRVLYITSVGGTTPESVESLHGPPEAQEDLRQACIQEYSPGKFWSYVDRFNTACFGLSGNVSAVAACSRNVSASLGIDRAGIDACATGQDGIALLTEDAASANAKGARSSPTLIINGVKFPGSRSPEAYKQAICGSFTSQPPECGTALSNQTVSAGGSC